MRTFTDSAAMRRALAITGALALLWAILAIARDGVTYHLAPLIVAAVPAAALGVEAKISSRALPGLAVLGAAIGLGMTLLLTAIGRLSGPSLLPFGGAVVEAVIFSVVGGVLGAIIGFLALRVEDNA